MRVFVAGHKGLVGSSILRNTPPGVEIITRSKSELNLLDQERVLDFFRVNQIDTVIMAAAKVGGIEANSTHQVKFLLQNLELQNSVIKSAMKSGIPNLVFLGSSCIYPKLAPQPLEEKSLLTGTLEPTNEGYATAKLAGVTLCKVISNEMGLNYFSLMPTNLYGPNDNFDYKSSHVPAALLRRFHESKFLNKSYVSIWGTGKVFREFMHVDDLATAIWHLLKGKHGGELINVGTGEEISILNFAKLIAKTVGFSGEIIFDSSKPEGSPRKLLDVSKIHSIGWSHQISLEDGINSTYEWFKWALKDGEIRGL